MAAAARGEHSSHRRSLLLRAIEKSCYSHLHRGIPGSSTGRSPACSRDEPTHRGVETPPAGYRSRRARAIRRFELTETSPDTLVIKLPEHGLNGEAIDLFDLASHEIEAGCWRSIELDASDAWVVTLEGIGILVRLRRMGERSGITVRVTSAHPMLTHRLSQTGILEWLAPGAS